MHFIDLYEFSFKLMIKSFRLLLIYNTTTHQLQQDLNTKRLVSRNRKTIFINEFINLPGQLSGQAAFLNSVLLAKHSCNIKKPSKASI